MTLFTVVTSENICLFYAEVQTNYYAGVVLHREKNTKRRDGHLQYRGLGMRELVRLKQDNFKEVCSK